LLVFGVSFVKRYRDMPLSSARKAPNESFLVSATVAGPVAPAEAVGAACAWVGAEAEVGAGAAVGAAGACVGAAGACVGAVEAVGAAHAASISARAIMLKKATRERVPARVDRVFIF
jgi:hypothetical protein